MSEKLQDPTFRHYLFGSISAGLFFGLGAGILDYLGGGRYRPLGKPRDLEHAAGIAIGVFVLSFLIGMISSAIRLARKRKGKK